MHPLRSHLKAVGAALLDPKMKNRAVGHWGNQGAGPTVLIAPPAASADIGRMEDALGQPMPSSLNEVLTEVSSNIVLD